MASWEDIMSNHLTMERGTWLTYATNAERRWRENEEEERRPGARPLVGRWLGPSLQDFYSGKGSGKKIFKEPCKGGE